MRCLDAFRGIVNDVKYPRNVTSHVINPKNVSRENMTRRRRSPKLPHRGMGGHCKGICGFIYVYFEAILSSTRNEQMRSSKPFRGNANGAKHPRNVISHIGSPKNVSRENMTRPGEIQK